MIRGVRENLFGLGTLAFMATMASYCLIASQEAKPERTELAPEGETVRKRISRIRTVFPGKGSEEGMIRIGYEDVGGATHTMMLTQNEATRHLERFINAPDLGTFLDGYGDTPFMADAPKDDSTKLREWFMGRLSEIERAPAAEFPVWFRQPVATGVTRHSLPISPSAPAPPPTAAAPATPP